MNGQEASREALSKVRLLLGVCGSFSAVAVPHVTTWLREAVGVTQVRTVMTASAHDLLGPRLVEVTTGATPVTTWRDHSGPGAVHVQLATWADVMVVLPATANFLAKAAHGIADDVLTTTMLAVECPVVISPVMNAAMWSKPAVQRNVAQLRDDGYQIVEPGKGMSLTQGHEEIGSIGDFRSVLAAALHQAATRTP